MEQMMNKEGMGMEMAGASMAAGKKEGKGMMMGMMACAVLAIAGIGFGVYELMQANSAKQQIADLKIEIKKDDGTTTTIETDKIEVKEDDKTIIISDNVSTVDTSEYIYIGKWGIKIKIPETIKNVGYTFANWGISDSLYIHARVKEDESTNVPYNDDFSDSHYNYGGQGAIGIIKNPHKCAMGEIDIEGESGSGVDCPIIVKNNRGEEVGIRYSHPQAVYATSEEQKNWEKQAVDAVQQMLEDPSNYSAI